MVSTKTLVNIATYGAVITVGTGFVLQTRLQGYVRQTDDYRAALRCLRSNSSAIRQLGEPIKEGKVDVGDDEANGSDGINKWIQVPVKGPNGSGTLYYWSTKKEKWELTKVELSLTDLPNERFVLMDKSDSSIKNVL